MEIKRYLISSSTDNTNMWIQQLKEVQVHVFCDASEETYGFIAYMRFTFESEEHKCVFVVSKSRLAPITIILPCLELNAAQIGVIMVSLIMEKFDYPLKRVQYWSYSALMLQCIMKTKNRMKVFVSNRVTEILDASEQSRHVLGAENPADVASGVTNHDKLVSGNWFDILYCIFCIVFLYFQQNDLQLNIEK